MEDKEGYTYSGKAGTVNWIDGKPAVILFLNDITQEKKTKEKLYELAYIDQLTGIPNRQRLKDDFAALEEKIANKETTGAVALFDLDYFKAVNDTYGHNTGDIVLRRLAEHLNGEKEFANRIYRLGGDEFVILLTDPPDGITKDDAVRNYYAEILSTTLRSYTLPNIDLECTLSMGVSFFPKHGKTLSEVLRKADIALYEAKGIGRNQMVFFEDRYDIAQKFKDLYINIQPILLSSGKTFGYELIDCGSGDKDNYESVSLSELNRALDALGLKDIENSMQYFISYTKQLLSPTVLSGLPKNKFIVQLRLTGNEPENDSDTYSLLKEAGYQLALCGLQSSKPLPDVFELVNYCKFAPEDKNTQMQKSIISDNPKVRFIAAKVDTQAAFEMAKSIGFHMHQGYFFSNLPAVVRRQKKSAR